MTTITSQKAPLGEALLVARENLWRILFWEPGTVRNAAWLRERF